MTNDIQAQIDQIVSRLRTIPSRVDAAVKSLEEKISQISSELDAAQSFANTIVDNATLGARDLQKKMKVLDETLANIANSA